MKPAALPTRPMPMRTPGVWRAIAGFVVWAVVFVALYAGHALGCLYIPSSLSPTLLTTVLLALWVLLLAACAGLAWRSGRHACGRQRAGSPAGTARFMWRATFLIDALALLAVLLTGLPLLAFPVCQA